MVETIAYFIRHGDSEPKVEGVINKNPKLTKEGKINANNLGKEMTDLSSKTILYTSNLSRARETSKVLNKNLKTKIIEMGKFRELNKFFFEHKFWNLKWWKYYFSYKKACKILDKILETSKRKNLVFVIHGRRIISLIGYKLGLSIKQMEKMISMKNCNVSKLIFEGKNLKKINYLNAEFRR